MSDCCDTMPVTQKTNQNQPVVALIGNPNCGKTTLFNALTGAKQRVGNWPGVTVEKKSGQLAVGTSTFEIIDLPGIYSLTLAAQSSAVDEQIACEFIAKDQADIIINIADASNLERHLYLTLQLREMGKPIVLALNMMDVARSRDIKINLQALTQALGCPVVALEANKVRGIDELKQALLHAQVNAPFHLPYPAAVTKAIAALTDAPLDASRIQAIKWLEGDALATANHPRIVQEAIAAQQTIIRDEAGEDADILLADARYQFIDQLMKQCVRKSTEVRTTWTSRLDRIVLNRVLGVPIFLAVMYLLFFFAINIGGAFQDLFDISSQTLCVDGLGYWLTQHGSPTWLTVLLANGIGKGINTTVTFIPVIGAMFLFLAFLEDSGYMARAAFVMDRLMRALGLPGKAFVPMIVGFGCNVPAVMGARTLENKRDRIITIMMAPFMSCGARLAIYAVFTAAFFPRGGQNVVFALYLIGILMAVLTGFFLRQTLLRGEPAPLVMELPSYHVPRLKTLALHAWQRLKGFVVRAGKLIIPISVLIGAANSFNLDGTMNTGDGATNSLLSLIGQWVTPLFAPMGLHTSNWPATVGLVTGILAKEVVIGTLNTLYSQSGHLTAAVSANGFNLWANLHAALQSVPDNFAQLSSAFANPVVAQAPLSTVNQGVYGLMAQEFDGKTGAFAYLLFVLLYFPCISTTAAMLREVHRGWAIFSALWMTGIAYGTATVFYQAATWSRHPLFSSLWIASLLISVISILIAIRFYARGPKLNLNVSMIGESA